MRDLPRGTCLGRKRAARTLVECRGLWRAQLHLLDLVAEMDVHWEVLTRDHTMDDAWACPDCRLIVAEPARTPESYVTVLHELGHIADPRPRPTILEAELFAWEWAAAQAREELIHRRVIAAQAQECMEDYLHHARSDRRHWLPGAADPFWARLDRVCQAA